ncbi:hypothetical protein Tco_1296848 [Tanacetum coccineum]
MQNCRFALLSLSHPLKLQSSWRGDLLGVGRWCSVLGDGCVGDGCDTATVVGSGEGSGEGEGECEGVGSGEWEGAGEWEGEDVILEGEVEGSEQLA